MRVLDGMAKATVVMTLLFTSSCFFPADPALTIRVSNQTDQTLRIFAEGEVFVGEAASGGEVKYQTDAIFPHYSVVAKDMQGDTVYTANFTKEDIGGKRTYRVVIPATGNGIEESNNMTGRQAFIKAGNLPPIQTTMRPILQASSNMPRRRG
jgi:hypothetical protein